MLEGAVNDEVTLLIQQVRTIVLSAYARACLSYRHWGSRKVPPALAEPLGLKISNGYRSSY